MDRVRQVLLIAASMFLYAMLAASWVRAQDCDVSPDHFQFGITEDYYPVILDSVGANCPLQMCDEIGVFDGDICVGASVFLGEWPLSIQAWQDDDLTPETDGFTCGNIMSFRIWRFGSGLEHGGVTPHYAIGNGTFCDYFYAELWMEVDDTEPPQITDGPVDTSYQCLVEVPQCDISAVAVVDNCDEAPSIQCVDDTVSDTITRTWTASDASGNTSAPWVQVISVLQPDLPVIICPGSDFEDTLQCGFDSVCIGLEVMYADTVIVANGRWLDNQLCLATEFPGQYVVEVVAVNACGDDSCVFNLNVVPDPPPSIMCPETPGVDTLCGVGTFCIDLPIQGADIVTVDFGTWSLDQLCFFADTSGTYIITVIAFEYEGRTIHCDTDTCEVTIELAVIERPDAPSTVECASELFDSVYYNQLLWAGVSNAAEYVVYRNGIACTTVVDTFFREQVVGANPYYQVAAGNRCGESELADPTTCYCCMIRGDVNHSGEEIIDISDLFYLIDHFFTEGPPPRCYHEADINGDGAELLDISDLVWLIDYMFRGGTEPVACP